MSEVEGDQPVGTDAPRFNRRVVWITAGIVAVVAVVAAGGLLLGPAGMPGASGSPSPSAAASSTAGATVAPTDGTSGSGSATDPAVRPTDPPLGFDEDGEPVAGITVTVSGLKAVAGEASGVGEIAGPAVQVTVEILNTTGAAFDLRTVQVTADAGVDRTSSGELSGPGVAPFPAELAAGERATAVYVFAVPADQRDVMRVFVDSVVTAPVLVFEGAAPAA